MFLPLSTGMSWRARTQARASRLLRRAGRALRADGMQPAATHRMLEAASGALEDLPQPASAATGLAMFSSSEETQHVHVPIRLPELAVLGDRFTVGPLLPLLTVCGEFFVLALNQEEIRLFRGTRLGMEQVDLDGYGLAAWQSMPPPRPAQVHAFVADRGGPAGRAVFHGSGTDADTERKEALTRHFRGIDRALREVLPDDGRVPLVLAAVRHMQSLYTKVNTYPHLLAQGIDGSPRDLGVEDLRQRAWPLVAPVLRRAGARAIAQFDELHGTGATAVGAVQALTVAEHGQVQTLLISTEASNWSHFPHEDRIGRLTDTPRIEEQVELAALATLRHAGQIFVVPAARMPLHAQVAATLRYPTPAPSPT